jgi:pantoate--beta-alanine ligase
MIPWIETIEQVRGAVDSARKAGHRIGLVPTMGALHDGHVRLIEQCRAHAQFIVVSIFVNPAQFGPSEDFARYPRTPDHDRARCEEGGADLVFAPVPDTMYPHGELSTYVEIPELFDRLEGASRPGHFRGVATVVLKLLNIVDPDVALFGQKDFQQQVVIRRMADDLNLRVEIVTAATVREPDGLALSSRNRYLGPDERRGAVVLSRALDLARSAVRAGERNAGQVRQIMREVIESESSAQLDYAEVADAETLLPLVALVPGCRAVALLAVRFGATRLIDNALLWE